MRSTAELSNASGAAENSSAERQEVRFGWMLESLNYEKILDQSDVLCQVIANDDVEEILNDGAEEILNDGAVEILNDDAEGILNDVPDRHESDYRSDDYDHLDSPDGVQHDGDYDHSRVVDASNNSFKDR